MHKGKGDLINKGLQYMDRLEVMGHVQVSNGAILRDNVYVAELIGSLSKDGPDPVNEQIEVKMEVRHCGPTSFNPIVPVMVDCELVDC